jgi:hypothetical protein
MRARRAGESALLLLDVIDELRRASVQYAVVGAMAASVHGVVRASMDADAVIALPVHDLSPFESQLQAAGFITELRYGDPDDPIGAVLGISDSVGNRVDLLAGLRGLVVVPFQGEQLRVVGREDFIAMKLFANGAQDVADAEFAAAAAGESLDTALVETLATRFGQETLAALRKLLDRRRRG